MIGPDEKLDLIIALLADISTQQRINGAMSMMPQPADAQKVVEIQLMAAGNIFAEFPALREIYKSVTKNE